MKTLFKNNNNVPAILNGSKNTLFGRPIDDVLAWDFFTSPDTNVRDEVNYYELEVAVPGLNRKDVTVQVDGNILYVFGQKKNTKHNDVIHEFSYATFHRSFVLPEDANAQTITAKCRDGMLTIRINKMKSTGKLISVSGDNNPNHGTGNRIGKKLAAWWGSVWK
jgi:HSP20 family protein